MIQKLLQEQKLRQEQKLLRVTEASANCRSFGIRQKLQILQNLEKSRFG